MKIKKISEQDYEFFQEKEALGIDGENITILESIGIFSIYQVLKEKEQLENVFNAKILEISEKIDLINSIEAGTDNQEFVGYITNIANTDLKI